MEEDQDDLKDSEMPLAPPQVTRTDHPQLTIATQKPPSVAFQTKYPEPSPRSHLGPFKTSELPLMAEKIYKVIEGSRKPSASWQNPRTLDSLGLSALLSGSLVSTSKDPHVDYTKKVQGCDLAHYPAKYLWWMGRTDLSRTLPRDWIISQDDSSLTVKQNPTTAMIAALRFLSGNLTNHVPTLNDQKELAQVMVERQLAAASLEETPAHTVAVPLGPRPAGVPKLLPALKIKTDMTRKHTFFLEMTLQVPTYGHAARQEEKFLWVNRAGAGAAKTISQVDTMAVLEQLDPQHPHLSGRMLARQMEPTVNHLDMRTYVVGLRPFNWQEITAGENTVRLMVHTDMEDLCDLIMAHLSKSPPHTLTPRAVRLDPVQSKVLTACTLLEGIHPHTTNVYTLQWEIQQALQSVAPGLRIRVIKGTWDLQRETKRDSQAVKVIKVAGAPTDMLRIQTALEKVFDPSQALHSVPGCSQVNPILNIMAPLSDLQKAGLSVVPHAREDSYFKGRLSQQVMNKNTHVQRLTSLTNVDKPVGPRDEYLAQVLSKVVGPTDHPLFSSVNLDPEQPTQVLLAYKGDHARAVRHTFQALPLVLYRLVGKDSFMWCTEESYMEASREYEITDKGQLRRISTKAKDGSNKRRRKLLTDNELNLLESMQAGIEDASEDVIVNISFVHHNRRSKDGKVLPPKEGTVDERTLGKNSTMDEQTLQGSISLDEHTLGEDSTLDEHTTGEDSPRDGDTM